MRLFGRRKGTGRPAVPEWAAPLFDADGYEHFLAAVTADLGRRGEEFEVRPDGEIVFERSEMRGYLTNLGQTCSQIPRDEWPDAIASHFDALAGANDATPDVSWDEARPRLRARIIGDVYTGGVELLIRPLAEGIDLVAAIDFPTSMTFARAEDPARWEVSEDEVFEIALRNVAEFEEQPDVDRLSSKEGGEVIALLGDSFCTTTRVFELDSFIGAQPEHGTVVAMPHRHVLLAHPIEDLDVIHAITTMVQMAAGMYEEGPGSISPSIYWLTAHGELVHLPSTTTDDGIEFVPPQEFLDVLNELADDEPPSN